MKIDVALVVVLALSNAAQATDESSKPTVPARSIVVPGPWASQRQAKLETAKLATPASRSSRARPALAGVNSIRIDPPVRISPMGSGGHFWLMGNAHADPDEPSTLVTCGMRARQDPLSWEGYLYKSTDGGSQWKLARVDSTLTADNQPNMISEVSCAIGRDGLITMSSSNYGHFLDEPYQIVSSVDGGETWSRPTGRRGWFDATRSVIDNFSERFRGRAYVFSNRVVTEYNAITKTSSEPLLWTANNARNLSAASFAEPKGQYVDPGWPSQAAVLKDGTVLAIYRTTYSRPNASAFPHAKRLGIEILRSRDGGVTLEAPVVVRSWEEDSTISPGQVWQSGGVSSLIAGLAVDHSKGRFSQRIYATWRESNNQSGTSSIMLAWSSDGGLSWSNARKVDDASGSAVPSRIRGVDPMAPAIAVSPDGTVGLLWMERFDTPSWRFSVSLDGGERFSPSIAIYESRTAGSETADLNSYMTGADYPTEFNGGFERQPEKIGFTLYTQAGDTGALTATMDGKFHAIWSARSDGTLWTARITVESPQMDRTWASLDGLTNVSWQTRLQVQAFHYDENSKTMLVDVMLVNTSVPVPTREPIIGENSRKRRLEADVRPRTLSRPLILRLNTTSSQIGRVTLLDADVLGPDQSPLIDMSPTIPAEGLAPGHRSAAKRLQFRIEDLRPDANPNFSRALSSSFDVFSN